MYNLQFNLQLNGDNKSIETLLNQILAKYQGQETSEFILQPQQEEDLENFLFSYE